MSTPQRTFRERILDARNRRSKNIEDRRTSSGVSPDDSVGFPSDGSAPRVDKPIEIDDLSSAPTLLTRVHRVQADRAARDWLEQKPPSRRHRVRYPSTKKPK